MASSPPKKNLSGWERRSDESKEQARQRAREWYAKNRERMLILGHKRYGILKLDPDRVRRENERTKQAVRDLRKEVLFTYGSCCACCGEHQYEFLALDHINGGGRKHRKAMSGRSGTSAYSYWRWFKKNGYPQGYRVLCHNCNQAIGSWGCCPHAKDVDNGKLAAA